MFCAHQYCAILLHFVGLIWDQPPVSNPASETHKKGGKNTVLQLHIVLWKTENQNNFWVWSLDPSVQKDDSSTVMLQCVLTVATYCITGMSKFMALKSQGQGGRGGGEEGNIQCLVFAADCEIGNLEECSN
jgi:hypothetical protein